jgi:hypothetical protein
MPIEVVELGKDGTLTTMPEPTPDPGISTTSAEPAPAASDGLPAVNGDSAPPPVPSTGEERLAAAPLPVEADEPDAPAETPITADYVNKRISRLTARHRTAEKALQDEQQARAQERAELLGRLDTLTRVMSGAAPAMPETPAQPTGPPSAEQYASHEDFVHAAATYATDQRMQQERQQQQQMRFQQDLMSREAHFKEAHPDFDSVVRTGLAGKVSPVLQQALMLVPDGPAVAYRLAQMPDLVQRLNGLPPPLVLVELGRLAPPTPPTTATPAVGSTNGTQPPATPLPEPMAPVGGGGSMVQPQYSDGMSQREYEQYRARTSQIPYVRRS